MNEKIEKIATDFLKKMKPDYETRSHTHCFNQDNPPCGLPGKHRCCLCEITEEEFKQKQK